MAGEARKSRFRDFGVYVQEVWCVWAYVSVIILFIEPWTLGLLCNHFGTCIHNSNPKKCTVYVCVCPYFGPLCPASLSPLFSGLAYFLLYCSADSVWACSGHCRSTHLLCTFTVQEGKQGAWPASTTETRSDYTVVHLEEISAAFSTDWQLLNKSLKQMLLWLTKAL